MQSLYTTLKPLSTENLDFPKLAILNFCGKTIGHLLFFVLLFMKSLKGGQHFMGGHLPLAGSQCK